VIKTTVKSTQDNKLRQAINSNTLMARQNWQFLEITLLNTILVHTHFYYGLLFRTTCCAQTFVHWVSERFYVCVHI